MTNYRNIVFTIIIALVSVVSATHAGFGIGLHAGYYMPLGWKDTFDTVYEGTGAVSYGFDVSYMREGVRWEWLLSVDSIRSDGNRVWPSDDGSWQKTTDTVSLTIMPITLSLRYYFMMERRFVPYLGLAAGYVRFKETDSTDQEGFGAGLVGGTEISVTEIIRLFIEGDWMSYPDLLGESGVSHYYGESDGGGLTGRLGLKIRF